MQWALLDTKYLVDSKKEDQLQHCTRTWVLTPIVVLSASNFKNNEIRSYHAFSSKINPTCHWQSTRLVQHTPSLQMQVGGPFLHVNTHRPHPRSKCELVGSFLFPYTYTDPPLLRMRVGAPFLCNNTSMDLTLAPNASWSYLVGTFFILFIIKLM